MLFFLHNRKRQEMESLGLHVPLPGLPEFYVGPLSCHHGSIQTHDLKYALPTPPAEGPYAFMQPGVGNVSVTRGVNIEGKDKRAPSFRIEP